MGPYSRPRLTFVCRRPDTKCPKELSEGNDLCSFVKVFGQFSAQREVMHVVQHHGTPSQDGKDSEPGKQTELAHRIRGVKKGRQKRLQAAPLIDT